MSVNQIILRCITEEDKIDTTAPERNVLCILPRRPFLNIAHIDNISKERERERTGRDHINELQNYFGVSIKDIESKLTKFIEVVDEETNHI